MMQAVERNKIHAQVVQLLGLESLNGVRVAIVPTASERLVFRGFVARSIRYWEEWGADVTVIDLSSSASSVRDGLEQAQVIYVAGGNTYTLMRRLAQAGVKEYLPELLASRLYVGESAGSIVAGPNISTAILTFDYNMEHAYTDRTGLGLAPFLLWPHYSATSNTVMQLRERLLPLVRRRAFSYGIERMRNGEVLLYRDGVTKRV